MEAIDTISNLEIELLDPDEPDAIDEDHLVEVEGGLAAMGLGLLHQIRFDLRIPFRRQDELGGEGTSVTTETEKFRVHVRYPYHSAVSFVELVGDERHGFGSSAVKTVREYLSFQLTGSHSSVVFEFVGPSPFHADATIQFRTRDGTNDAMFECEKVESRAYATLNFWWMDDSIEAEDVCDRLFDELENELGVFYLIASHDSTKYQRWERLQTKAREVAEGVRTTGVWSRLISMRKQSRSVAALFCDLVEFRSLQMAYEQEEETAVRRLDEVPGEFPLRDFVQAAMKERPAFSWEQLRDLLHFIEGRRSKLVEMTLIVLAAVIGAVVGSTITLLLSPTLSP